MVRATAIGVGLAAVLLGGCGLDEVPNGPAGVLLLAPADADPTTERMLEETSGYLERIVGGAPTVVRVGGGRYADVVSEARDRGAGLVLVLDADVLAADEVDAARMEGLGEWGFVLHARDVGDWRNLLGSRGTTVMLMAGASPLADQYAAYEALRRFGVRFYHPEQEYVPEHALADLRELALRPTAIQRGGSDDYVPDFAWRSWSFHSAHPLEHLESFSDAAHPIDEARHVNQWVVKNFGNRFRGPGRGIADAASQAQRDAELEQMRVEMGFPQGTGLTLHNQQQGANADIDPSSDVPVREQIESLVASRLADLPDARWFGIHFGPTEFTTTPDQETVQWIDWAGQKALELSPDIEVEINNHITGAQPSPNYGDLGCPNGTNEDGLIDYYDLAFHTDPRLKVRVHTVMFYPLEGPARVYNQQSFAHKLCLMQQASAAGRRLGWFPEGAWWLSFDNPIPVYLPLHVWTRWRDVDLLKPLLASRGGGTVEDHRMFNTGQEWGYWQQDYAVGLLGWNADITPPQLWDEMLDPMCEAADWRDGCPLKTEMMSIVTALVEHQREFFLERSDFRGRPGGLYAYFAGEDEADEIAAASGFEFRPVRVGFDEVMRWSEAEVEHFRRTDLAAINESAIFHAELHDRLYAARELVPETGQAWFDEIADGIEIDEMRARQASALYTALVEAHEEELMEASNPLLAGEPQYGAAQMVLAQAELVIRRREAAYRYPAAQTHGGGITPDTAVPNGTTYPYRVHTKTNLLTYWRNRDAQVRLILDGGTAGEAEVVAMREAMDDPGAPLQIEWPSQVSGELSIGEHLVGPSVSSLDLGDAPGFWPVSGTLLTDTGEHTIHGGIARATIRAMTPRRDGLTLTMPDDAASAALIGSVFPALQWAWVDDPDALVLGIDDDGDGSIKIGHVVQALASPDGAGFVTEPVAFEIPVATSNSRIEVGLTKVVLRGAIVSGGLASPVELTAEMSVPDLVQGLVELAGFDEEGALQAIASINGFDPNDPPPTVSVAGELSIEPLPE